MPVSLSLPLSSLLLSLSHTFIWVVFHLEDDRGDDDAKNVHFQL